MSTQTKEAPTAPSTPVMTQRQIMLVIIGLMAGMFLASLDQTIVSTAIRTIGDDLHGLNQQAWVTTAYMITSTISTPIYGKLSDIFGRRPLYLFGIGVFILGSILSTFSTSMLMLAAFRGVQGIGAGALMSLPMAIMGDMLAPRERAKYQGYFLGVFGISSVIGPLIGGVFAGAATILGVTGWRWVFLINVPIGIIAFAMVWRFLHLPKFGNDKAKPVIDWWGSTFVIVTLLPLLLVAEEGRGWGWGSANSITCYVIAVIGLIAFIITEKKMGRNAIIPLSLFSVRPFSMATILGFFVGFGMFGAMMTIPLYLQIVLGLTPTESGLATLPMMAGIMAASIGSGIYISKTGSYSIFPKTGTLMMCVGYIMLTFMTVDRPLWYLMICMFFIGLGLGQLMQTLTLASQNAVAPTDMGVATSAATFFRQIGGTLGTAVLLSVLFTSMPADIKKEMGNESTLKTALYAATNPAVAGADNNKAIMEKMWTPIVGPIEQNIQTKLDAVTSQTIAAADQAVTDDSAKAAAESQTLTAAASQAHASVVNNKLTVDWSNEDQRTYWVDQVAPTIAQNINDGNGSSSNSEVSTSDTSFLTGADAALTRPFMVGFNDATITIYWIGFGVVAFAFILSLFFKVPPLRKQSALQDAADEAAGADKNMVEEAMLTTGSLPIIPAAEPIHSVQVQEDYANDEAEDAELANPATVGAAVITEEATEEAAEDQTAETAASVENQPAEHQAPVLKEVESPVAASLTAQRESTPSETIALVDPTPSEESEVLTATSAVAASAPLAEPTLSAPAAPVQIHQVPQGSVQVQQPSWQAISAIAGAAGGAVGFVVGFIAGRLSK